MAISRIGGTAGNTLKGQSPGLTMSAYNAAVTGTSGTITFPKPYASVPVVVACSATSGGFIQITATTAIGFNWSSGATMANVTYTVTGVLA